MDYDYDFAVSPPFARSITGFNLCFPTTGVVATYHLPFLSAQLANVVVPRFNVYCLAVVIGL